MNGPIEGSWIGVTPMISNSLSVGKAMPTIRSIPSHCGNVERSMWLVVVFAASTVRGVLPMAVKRVINGVQAGPMGKANTSPFEGDDGLTLIDAGYPGKEAAVFGAVSGLPRTPDPLRHRIWTDR